MATGNYRQQQMATGNGGKIQVVAIVDRLFYKKHLRESYHNGISPPTPVSRSVAQTRSGRGGRRFKSSHSDHFYINFQMHFFKMLKAGA